MPTQATSFPSYLKLYNSTSEGDGAGAVYHRRTTPMYKQSMNSRNTLRNLILRQEKCFQENNLLLIMKTASVHI